MNFVEELFDMQKFSKASLEIIILIFAVYLLLATTLSAIFLLNLYIFWFDVIAHLVGGALVGFVALQLYFLRNYSDRVHNSAFFIIIFPLLVAASLGVFWEFFEFIVDSASLSFGLSKVHQATVADTLSDLLFDIIGGIASGILYLTLWQRKSQ